MFNNPVQDAYVNWDRGEPNNAAGVEHYLSFRTTGKWNDYATALYNAPNNQYVVEWERAAVPEPASLFVWTLLGVIACGLRLSRRHKVT